ncbi:unnamed protein product [Caenorhabditis sp. 36 PRJEB53466]|nr:unnamed protein product [Caenorhabditis sp. 36 PRJEB53466]
MKPSSTSTQKCLVCGSENTRGKHFDVQCCRACAVFFRRRAGTKYLSLKCQSAHCDQKVYFCKPCRLRKCYEVGMKTDKFQHNRDPLTVRKPSPDSFGHFLGRSQFVFFCSPEQTSFKKTFIDMRVLISQTSKILQFGPETPYIGPSQLHKLTASFNFSTADPKCGKFYEKLDQKTMVRFWEYYVFRTAKWMNNFEEFQSIPHEMKLQLVLSFWHVFGRLDKLAATARSRREKVCETDRMWAMSNGMMMDMDRTKVDFKWLTDHSRDQVLFFLNSLTTWDLTPCIQTIVDLEITDVELNYMLAQLAFAYAGKRFQGDVLRICEKFQETLANDLHRYYVNELKMPRYFGRLSQLMKINNAIQRDIFVNRPRAELASLFNVFNVKFSHPDMFFDTGFC